MGFKVRPAHRTPAKSHHHTEPSVPSATTALPSGVNRSRAHVTSVTSRLTSRPEATSHSCSPLARPVSSQRPSALNGRVGNRLVSTLGSGIRRMVEAVVGDQKRSAAELPAPTNVAAVCPSGLTSAPKTLSLGRSTRRSSLPLAMSHTRSV